MSSPVPRTRTMTCAPWCVKQFQKKLQVNSIWVWLYHQSYFSLWFYYYSIIFWHREWSEGWRCKLPVPSKGQKEERKSTDRKIVQKDRQTKKIIWKHRPQGHNNTLVFLNTSPSPASSPEEDAKDVGYEQHQADSGGETLSVAAPLDLLVLGHIGQGSPEHHDAGRHPGQQRPRALRVLLLQNHLCIHHSERRSGVSSQCGGCTWAADRWWDLSEVLWGNQRSLPGSEINIPQVPHSSKTKLITFK